jgi:hypothetical protein
MGQRHRQFCLTLPASMHSMTRFSHTTSRSHWNCILRIAAFSTHEAQPQINVPSTGDKHYHAMPNRLICNPCDWWPFIASGEPHVPTPTVSRCRPAKHTNRECHRHADDFTVTAAHLSDGALDVTDNGTLLVVHELDTDLNKAKNQPHTP